MAHSFRGFSPRFQGDSLLANLGLVEALQTIADARSVTVAQVAIAWVLSCGDGIVPLVGARRPDRLAESLGALNLTLTDDDLAAIDLAVPAGAAAGERYGPRQWRSWTANGKERRLLVAEPPIALLQAWLRKAPVKVVGWSP
ncbi:aldo/keto reductase [Plantactinospora sp. CA-294935]|uniref:aldo/keto reductase n=1 Tax=Plantactinospora sp. CA-294935 TaxID=3240012 RepID=UPI003D8C2690